MNPASTPTNQPFEPDFNSTKKKLTIPQDFILLAGCVRQYFGVRFFTFFWWVRAYVRSKFGLAFQRVRRYVPVGRLCVLYAEYTAYKRYKSPVLVAFFFGEDTQCRSLYSIDEGIFWDDTGASAWPGGGARGGVSNKTRTRSICHARTTHGSAVCVVQEVHTLVKHGGEESSR